MATKQQLEAWINSVGRELKLKLVLEYNNAKSISILVDRENQGFSYLGHYRNARELQQALITTLNVRHYLNQN